MNVAIGSFSLIQKRSCSISHTQSAGAQLVWQSIYANEKFPPTKNTSKSDFIRRFLASQRSRVRPFALQKGHITWSWRIPVTFQGNTSSYFFGERHTKWAPLSPRFFKWSYIALLITGRDPPCREWHLSCDSISIIASCRADVCRSWDSHVLWVFRLAVRCWRQRNCKLQDGFNDSWLFS